MLAQQLVMWHETKHRAEVTVIVQSPQKDHFAVVYADGFFRLWNASCHTKSVIALALDKAGAQLAFRLPRYPHHLVGHRRRGGLIAV